MINLVRSAPETLSATSVSVIRVGLGCMFLWSSLPKIRQPYSFLSNVYQYELVGPSLGLFVAIILPWVELLVGICLVSAVFVGGALLLSIALTAMFSFVLAVALHRGLSISCGCFSAPSASMISYMTLIRAVVILLLCMVAYRGATKEETVPARPTAGTTCV